MLQTLICVLESLEDENWIELKLEPGHDAEKADIIWRFPNKSCAVQVKHSRNQIALGMVEKWAKDFEGSVETSWWICALPYERS